MFIDSLNNFVPTQFTRETSDQAKATQLLHSWCEHIFPVLKCCFLVCKTLKTLQVLFYQFAPANIWETQAYTFQSQKNTLSQTQL